MSKTYVIPDIHGRLDLLNAALEAIAARGDGPGTIITLGDYVDRGPDGRGVIERLMALHCPPNRMRHGADGVFICLKGNHEDIMAQTCDGAVRSTDWWVSNGGGTTLRSYGAPGTSWFDLKFVPERHLAWISQLPLYHVDDHRIYVHAGVSPNIPLYDQDAEILLWKRYRPDDEGGHGRYHVVHGHTPYPDAPIRKKNRTNLDGGAYATGRLVVGVFDDAIPGGPVDVIEVRGELGFREAA